MVTSNNLIGIFPIVIVLLTVLVVPFMKEIVPDMELATYFLPLLGLYAIPLGPAPTAIIPAELLVVVLRTDTVFEPVLLT